MTNGKRAETLVSTQDRMRGSFVSKLRTSCNRSMPSFTGISYKGSKKKKERKREATLNTSTCSILPTKPRKKAEGKRTAASPLLIGQS